MSVSQENLLSPIKTELYGFYNPIRNAPHFVMPVFASGDAFFVQHADDRGVVKGFSSFGSRPKDIVPMDEESIRILEKGRKRFWLPNLFSSSCPRRKVGDPAFYAFAFENGAIVSGEKEPTAAYLREHLEDLEASPFAKFDVLCFIGDAKAARNITQDIRRLLDELTDLEVV